MGDLPTVPVPGGGVEYLDIPGDGLPPVLLLHEGLGSVGLWRDFPQAVAAATGRRTVAYSRLGHGWSDLPQRKRTREFLHEEATTVVPEVCAALDLTEPVLVGHSDGASIALLHAANAPVSGLVVLAPHVIVEDVSLAGIRAARQAYVDGGLRARMARHHRDPDVTFWNWNDAWLADEFRDWDIRAELATITCDVLAVQGTADPYGTLAQVEGIRAALGAEQVELLVVDGGHEPHVEHRDRVVAAIAGLSRNDRR